LYIKGLERKQFSPGLAGRCIFITRKKSPQPSKHDWWMFGKLLIKLYICLWQKPTFNW